MEQLAIRILVLNQMRICRNGTSLSKLDSNPWKGISNCLVGRYSHVTYRDISRIILLNGKFHFIIRVKPMQSHVYDTVVLDR